MLLDSNILIYSITKEHQALLAPYVYAVGNSVSLLTKLEVLGFHRLQDVEKSLFSEIFDRLQVLPIDEETVDAAIALRQQKSMTVGDAIIAATALRYELPLVTRNIADFKWIDGLALVNPFE